MESEIKTQKTYKAAIGVRGDMLYCPLPLSIDSYWNCLTNCYHCYSRRLNHVWGTDLRPANPNRIRKKLKNGLTNKNPKSYLAWALKEKKTIRLGNRTDPYQKAELKYHITREILKILIDLKWTFVIQTKFLNNMMMNLDLLEKAHERKLLTILAIITPGAEYDQQYLERGRTPSIENRLDIIKRLIENGYHVGVNGEPFIPGLHTTKQFRNILKRLKVVEVKSYNTYNLHFNDYVAKQLYSIGIDIEKIWNYNQDKEWKKIQRKLCQIATEEKMILGCPDFVNTGKDWIEKTNTCCGINVSNPSKFNTHFWKHRLQKNMNPKKVSESTWEGIGNKELGEKIIKGIPCENYTMRDAGML